MPTSVNPHLLLGFDLHLRLTQLFRLPEENYQAVGSSEIIFIKLSAQIQSGSQDPNGIVESKSLQINK